jgi:hypothetical protein
MSQLINHLVIHVQFVLQIERKLIKVPFVDILEFAIFVDEVEALFNEGCAELEFIDTDSM